jgi:hypothetical protein
LIAGQVRRRLQERPHRRLVRDVEVQEARRDLLADVLHPERRNHLRGEVLLLHRGSQRQTDVDLVLLGLPDGRHEVVGVAGPVQLGPDGAEVGRGRVLDLHLRPAGELDPHLDLVNGDEDRRREHDDDRQPHPEVALPHEVDLGILEDVQHDLLPAPRPEPLGVRC